MEYNTWVGGHQVKTDVKVREMETCEKDEQFDKSGGWERIECIM